MGEPRTIASLTERLTAARARIRRYTPTEAWTAMAGRALLVDIRAQPERDRYGAIPGSLHVPRLVLEWRMCAESGYGHPAVTGRDTTLVLLCNEGFGSSLAAADLRDLGFLDVGDVEGGFAGWRAAALPVVVATRTPPGELMGMGPPERGAAVQDRPKFSQ